MRPYIYGLFVYIGGIMAKNEETTNTYYGILMNRKLVDKGIYLFRPEYLIEGTVEEYDGEVYFTDQMGNEFLSIHDLDTIHLDEETAVAYVIKEEELLGRYPDLSIQEAKGEYFDSCRDVTHVGFYLENEDKIAVIPFDFRTMYAKLNNMKFSGDDSVVRIPMSEFTKDGSEGKYTVTGDDKAGLDQFLEEYNGQELIVIDRKVFEDILKLETYESLKGKLDEIYTQFKEMTQHFLNEDGTLTESLDEKQQRFYTTNDINGNHVVELFDAFNQTVAELDDLKAIHSAIDKVASVLTDLTLVLDEKGRERPEIDAAIEYLYTLFDVYDNLKKSTDVGYIKQKIAKLAVDGRRNIVAVGKVYDDVCKEESKDAPDALHQQKEQELIDTFNNASRKIKIDVRDVKKFFDAKIIGQEEAKRDVIAAIVMNMLSDNPTDKNNCLLVGPTGSGKTLIAETVSEYFDLPMEIIDTTQLTMPGYVGANIEDFLARLISKAGGDIKKAEEGIVVFDEIDKKGSEKNDDVSGKGVLNTLLPFLQGTTYDVKYNGRTYPFNTSKLTIFATGAFTDVAKGKKTNSTSENYKATRIGFNADIRSKKDNEEDIKYEKLEIDDFVKYGNMPVEIMGRFPIIAQLTGHTKDSLRTILTGSNVSALLAEKRKLEKLGVTLSWTNGYLDRVAEEAIKLKTGGRSLKTTVEKSVKEARWEVLESLGTYCSIVLTEKSVDNNKDCILIDQNGVSHNLEEILKAKSETGLMVVEEAPKVKTLIDSKK